MTARVGARARSAREVVRGRRAPGLDVYPAREFGVGRAHLAEPVAGPTRAHLEVEMEDGAAFPDLFEAERERRERLDGFGSPLKR